MQFVIPWIVVNYLYNAGIYYPVAIMIIQTSIEVQVSMTFQWVYIIKTVPTT